MRPRNVVLTAILGVLLIAAPAGAGDALFGDILSLPERPALAIGSEAQHREREARNLRRGYWERERKLMAAERAARTPVSAIR